jgi:hypothetical protein
MYSGGRQNKAPRLGRIAAMQVLRSIRRRFEWWCQLLGLQVHPGEAQASEPSKPKGAQGSWAYNVFLGDRVFRRFGTFASHAAEVKIVRNHQAHFIFETRAMGWHGMVWHGAAWYGALRRGTAWEGIGLHAISLSLCSVCLGAAVASFQSTH